MPTHKQLMEIWSSQFCLFGGSGIPKSANKTDTEGLGATDEQTTDSVATSSDDGFEDQYLDETFGAITLDTNEMELDISFDLIEKSDK